MTKVDIILLEELLAGFEEKCQVGYMDLSFPTNYAFVAPVALAGPTILMRYPNSVMTDSQVWPFYCHHGTKERKQ